MKCRFCKAKIKKTDKKCPQCKKVDPQPITNPVFSAKKRTAIVVGCISALAVLAVTLLIAMLAGWDLGSWFRWLKPRENNVYFRKNYTVSDRKAEKKRNEVVATLGDMELTNGMLQVYYWRQVYDFVESYGTSASYLGLDYTGNMAKQTYIDGSSTWQQYFLKSALQMWQTNQAFAILADENNYQLPEEYRDFFDNMDQRLEESAKASGYSSVEEMVRKELGAGCTAQEYADYLRVYYRGYLYFRERYDALAPDEEQIEAYYDEHKSELNKEGFFKDGTTYVDFRHLMLYPEGGTMHTDGMIYYSDEAWDACKGKAEAILAQWRNGERTEDSFVDLIKAYSQDTTTNRTGGLYPDTVKGDMLESVDTWLFDTSRKSGDCELIKTQNGYHIVYFVESEEIWHAEARTALQEEMGQEMVAEVLSQFTFEVNYKKIVLGKVEFSK